MKGPSLLKMTKASPMKVEADPKELEKRKKKEQEANKNKLKKEILKSNKESTFGDAFKKARKAGKSEFTYEGKKYHTKTKEEVAKKTEVKKMEPRKITKVEPTTKTDNAQPKKVTAAKPLTRAEKRAKKNEKIRKKQAERTAKLKKFLKGFGPRSRKNK